MVSSLYHSTFEKKGKRQLNMCVSKPVFTCIRKKAVDNVQRQVNRGSDMPQSMEKQMTMKEYYFHFLFGSTLDM